MKDIERRLRDLGERVREEQGPSVLLPSTMRAARRRRMATGIVGMFTVIALVSGVTYAGANIGGTPSEVDPADPRPSVGVPTLLVTSIDDERVILAISLEARLVCLVGSSLDESATTIEVVRGEEAKDPVLSLRPADSETSVPGQDATCAGQLDEMGLRSIIASPEEHFLLVDRGSNQEMGTLRVFSADMEPPAECGPPIDFEPSFLPRGWISELQEGSAVGTDVIQGVIGHYGNDSSPGSEEKSSDGFLDLIVTSLPYSSVDASPDGIEVLGSPATLHEGGSGSWLTFGHGGCSFELIGYGVEADALIRFAEGLRPRRSAGEDPAERCRPAVDFEPTYLPQGWDPELKPGEGGGGFFPGVLGHYAATASAATSATQAGYVDLIAEEPPYQQSGKTVIRVLGDRATLGDIHEGFSVEFERGGCDFFLVAFGLDRAELRRFAEGLRS